jgi:hypothetical protein
MMMELHARSGDVIWVKRGAILAFQDGRFPEGGTRVLLKGGVWIEVTEKVREVLDRYELEDEFAS